MRKSLLFAFVLTRPAEIRTDTALLHNNNMLPDFIHFENQKNKSLEKSSECQELLHKS